MKKEDCRLYWRRDCDGPNTKCKGCPKRQTFSNTIITKYKSI